MKSIKQLACFMITALLTITSVTSALAGTWKNSPSGWRYEESGTYLKSAWVTDTTGTYHIGSDGTMDTGWYLENGKWYLLDPESGRMLTGWQWADG